MDLTAGGGPRPAAPEGVTARAVETLLTERARDFLAAGPVDAVALIEHVCQLPGAPRVVAEQMAFALFAGRPEFEVDAGGRWMLRETGMRGAGWGLNGLSALASRRPGGAHRREPGAEGREPLDLAPADDLASLPYAVVDVETTGTRAGGDRVTEFAAIVVENGAIVERFETLVNPQRPIPPWISALTHITWDMVKDAPTFHDICDEVLRVLGGRVFVAHNAAFDWRFVSAEVQRATGQRLEGRTLCTVRLARRLLPQLRSRKLDNLAVFYDVEIPARHRAGGDAIATARILLRLLADARGRDCRSWIDLERLLAAPPAPRRRRRASALPRPIDKDTTA